MSISATTTGNTLLGRRKRRETFITKTTSATISPDSSSTVAGQENIHESSKSCQISEENTPDGNPYETIDRYIQTLDIFPNIAANDDLVRSFQNKLLFDVHTSMKIQVTYFFKTYYNRLPTSEEMEQFGSLVFQ
jgi:hypothetical protein